MVRLVGWEWCGMSSIWKKGECYSKYGLWDLKCDKIKKLNKNINIRFNKGGKI